MQNKKINEHFQTKDIDHSIIKSLENNFKAFQILRKNAVFEKKPNSRSYGE